MKERSGMPYDVVAFSTDENALMLTNAQEGVFHRCMRHAWVNGSLPCSEVALAAIAREPIEVFRQLWKPPLEDMWTTHPEIANRLINKKQEEERQFKSEQSKRKTKAARVANRARWNRNPSGVRPDSSAEEDRSPVGSLPSPPHPLNKREDIYPSNFDFFWEAYPRKIGKLAALKVWKRINPAESLLAKILTSVEAAKKSAQWRESHGRFIPHPATWLNRGGWDDEPELKAKAAAGGFVPVI